MRKTLVLGAFALMMTLPLVSSAASIVSIFKTSSTGQSLIAVGDTIQFEIALTVDAGVNVNALFFQVTGDRVGALRSANPTWPGVANTVINWEWHYLVGSKVKFDTNGAIIPAPAAIAGPGLAVAGSYGFFGQAGKTGQGNGSMVGTVTIHATDYGVYEGGAFLYPTLDAVFGSGGSVPTTVSTSSFSTIPEPGTAVLMLLGLSGFGVMGRKNRSSS